MARKIKSKFWLVISLILAVVSWYYQIDEEGEKSQITAESVAAYGRPITDQYEVLEGCELLKNRRNDGDSFFVKHTQGKTEFRLYYVDTPESKYKEYSNGEDNGKRISDQGRYFDGLDREKTTALGATAKHFVNQLLENKKFRVITRWENVFGPERRYAFVELEHAGEKVFLHELLIIKGYGRIHTKPAKMPNGMSVKKQIAKLRNLEKSAKKSKQGGWK